MSTSLLPDDLWNIIAPNLPPETPKPKGGRPRVPDRAALTGVLFVLKTGCPWQPLPASWDMAAAAPAGGVFGIGSARVYGIGCIGSCSTGSVHGGESIGRGQRWTRPASRQKGGEATGPNPTDRGRPDTKHHLFVDRNGVPLVVLISPANWHDSRMLEPLLDAVRPIKGLWGCPRKRPDKLHGNRVGPLVPSY